VDLAIADLAIADLAIVDLAIVNLQSWVVDTEVGIQQSPGRSAKIASSSAELSVMHDIMRA